MATWGNRFKDWDPMRDDYNDSMYEAQYADENIDSGVQLNHSKLYVTNIPQTLNEEGLKLAFKKYGNVIRIHMSRDPKKRYAFVFFDSPSEAKLALMNLNKSEPLKLNITIAHKKNTDEQYVTRNSNAQPSASYKNNSRDDTSSVSSKGINMNNQSNIEEDNMEEYEGEDESLSGILNPELNIEFTKLQLQELEVKRKEIQVQKKLLLLNSGKKEPSRTVTADGKIILKNNVVNNRSDPTVDTTFSGAGDSLNVPGLQRVSLRFCLSCGSRGEMFCSGCGVAPYCSPQCQRADWIMRHKTVCHNLARIDGMESQNRNPGIVEDSASTMKMSKISPRPQSKDDDYTSGNNDSEKADQRYKKKPIGNRLRVPTKGPLRRPKIMEMENPDKKQNEPETIENTSQVVRDRKPNFRTRNEKGNSKETNGKVENGPAPDADVLINDISQQVKGPRSILNNSRENNRFIVKEQIQSQESAVVIPKIEILPKMYVVATFKVGDTFLLSVDVDAKECQSKQKGLICLALNSDCEDKYNILCNDYCIDCNNDPNTYTPKPGELFSYNNGEDKLHWLRARCLNSVSAALIDSCQIASFAVGICKKIPEKYIELPEFCCVLDADRVKFQIGDQLSATIISKLSCESVRVELEHVGSNEKLGQGTISRWSPDIELPIVTNTKPIPQVPRPSVKNNSRVILIETSKLDAVYIRSSDNNIARRYNDVIQEALLCGQKSTPLKEPPARGQVVIAKYTDGLFYRALVQRINATRTKYQLEYIEFGNVEPQTLDTLYECPESLNLENQPTVVSMIKVSSDYPNITEPAKDYIAKIRDEEQEMILILPDGSQSAPSGSQAILTLEKNKENFNRRVVEMCKPGWKIMEQKGTDVVELSPIMYQDLEYVGVPPSGCQFIVLDVGSLIFGLVSGYPQDTPRASYILNQLPDMMADYCNSDLGREPYLPFTNELCIAKLPPHEEWFRAVMIDQTDGAGGSQAQVAYIDYGNVATVPVKVLRKMLPDFVKGIPALASTLRIRDFPTSPTTDMLERALTFLEMDDLDRGRLTISNCTKITSDTYEVNAPGLIAAMTQKGIL